MPMISVIVPVYNVEQYLLRCINTIQRQTFEDLEIILVDDGSMDGCPMICDELSIQDSRIKVIHKENGGLSSARNAGIRAAKGEYIGFVDSDDWIALDMYQLLYEIATEHDADIACGQIIRMKKISSEQPHDETRPRNVQVFSQEEYAKKYFKIGSNDTVHYVVNKLYKKEVAKAMSFPEGLINEDVEGFFRALLKSKVIAATESIVYYYWYNEGGISTKWFSQKQMDLLTVWKNVHNLCESKKKEWVDYAQINYYRANFGLLTRLAFDEADEGKFEEEKANLLSNLKLHKRDLLKSNIPMSRKIIIECMCCNYGAAQCFLRLAKKIRKV